MTLFVFDIETIPDVDLGRKLLDLPATLTAEEVADAMFVTTRDKTGNEFLRHHCQQIVAISCLLRHQDELHLWSLGELTSTESEIIQRFFAGLKKYLPTLVSWNGAGFDLPVLHYRALKHAIPAPEYWEMGEHMSAFKWNNYLNRYHLRHIDLMDILSGYQARSAAPLDDIALMLGLPGKMGMSGDKVWPAYCQGQLSAIRDYCETDVLNTYLVHLRFECMRGVLTPDVYAQEVDKLKKYLAQTDKSHLQAYYKAWLAA